MSIAGIENKIGRIVRQTPGFVAGNIKALPEVLKGEVVEKPIAIAGEHIARLAGCRKTADSFKQYLADITPCTRYIYESCGVPKTGEFLTQDIGLKIKKAFNKAFTPIKEVLNNRLKQKYKYITETYGIRNAVPRNPIASFFGNDIYYKRSKGPLSFGELFRTDKDGFLL